MSFLSVLAGIVVAVLAAALLAGGYLALVTRRIARDAERAVPPVGKFIQINGEHIHYIERGEGPPILLIHGLGGTLHHMRRPLMEAFGDGYRLIAPDRPGSGYSTLSRREMGLADHVRFVVAFMDELKIDRPLIVGHSLGGAIALATALTHPQRVAGLALLSPLTHQHDDVPAAFGPLKIRPPLLRWLISRTVAVPMTLKAAPQAVDLVFGPQQPPADFAVEGGAMIGLRPSHFHATSTDFCGLRGEMEPLVERYGELKMPVGVFFGTADRILDHERHGLSLVGKIEGLDLEIAEGIGHMPQYAETERVVSFIRRIAARAFLLGPANV